VDHRTAAGDGDVFVIGPDAVWCWASPVLTLSYAERQGPALVDLALVDLALVDLALVDLALFGYFAVRCCDQPASRRSGGRGGAGLRAPGGPVRAVARPIPLDAPMTTTVRGRDELTASARL
jgi:hypothetical protein